MKTVYRKFLVLCMLSMLTLLLSACFLRSLAGNVSGEEGDFTAHVGATALTANCNVSSLPGHEGEVTCFYVIEWDPSFELESTVILVSEFGLFGVLVDPLILQVPETASNFQAIFQSGPTPREAVITVTDSFNVQPGTAITAEPGQQFVILEFPDDVPPTLPDGDPRNGVEFDFELDFDVPTLDPVDVKGMFAGRIEVNGQTFYVPLYPCVTDFSAIPAIEIPVDSSPQFLIPQIADHINAGEDATCIGEVYDFSDLDPAGRQYLPLMARP
jgi:hypothetical protein